MFVNAAEPTARRNFAWMGDRWLNTTRAKKFIDKIIMFRVSQVERLFFFLFCAFVTFLKL